MDRQDIDALLIGALYGELTPADEARLATHLESHPADRGALDDLKVARQAVVDSRIFAVQLDPPQAVSALLLQEAHRRAPRRPVTASGEHEESWFYRFTRTFMAHPAMAAAAMLVLVLGGAGIAYMKKGDQYAAQEVAAPAMSAESADRPAGAAPAAMPMNEGAAAQGSASVDGLAFEADVYAGAPPADEAAELERAKDADTASRRWENQDQKKAKLAEERSDTRQRKAPSRGIVVGTEKGALKDQELALGKSGGFKSSGADKSIATGGAGVAGGRDDVVSKADYAQPPPPAAQTIVENKPGAPSPSAGAAPAPKRATTAPTTIARPDPRPVDDAAPKAEAKRDDSSLIAWAKREHQRAVALARKDCNAAAKVALGVSTRASDYYAQYMATDRALKQCAQYINAERDREAEKNAKSRAQKRTNADEPASVETK